MNLEYKIQLGVAQDIEELEQLYDALNDYLQDTINYPGWKKGIYPTRAEAENGIQEQNLFVLRYGDAIAGSVIVNNHSEAGYADASWRVECKEDEAMVIHTLAVHPQYMQKGVAALLMEHACRYAQIRGMRALRLDVYEKNSPAIHLYQSCGYQYIGKADLGLGQYGLDTFLLYELPL